MKRGLTSGAWISGCLFRDRAMRWALPLLAAGGAFLLSACAAPVVGGLTLNELSSATSAMSSGLTGKSLTEMAMDLVTGKDCRIMESIMRDERKLCEDRGSPETENDFHGVLTLGEKREPHLDSGVFVDTGGFRGSGAVIEASATAPR